MSDKVHESLTQNPCTIFNSNIVIYKFIHSNRNTINVNTLVVKGREYYRALVVSSAQVITKKLNHDNTYKNKYTSDTTKIDALVEKSTKKETDNINTLLNN